jgi:hypothetical protein
MPRQIRDIAASIAVLLFLFVMLTIISPQVRERVTAGGAGSREWQASSGAVTHAAVSAFAITSSYAADNTYLFSFLVVATVMFILMFRT